MKENEYITFCKCGCRNGVVLKFDNEDDELSIITNFISSLVGASEFIIPVQLVSDIFYTMQNKGKMSFKEKIKRIWYIITSKEYCYFDILVDKDELQKFKEFVAKL